ncbi:hypothetical protein [Chelatococcus sp. XZ-Ab1]|uniref:hypothetical protein n=1 Tax=Chelatococcus sp. XZ-Ab1 TaxID=3034027 RepID=UPI0023E3E6A1|nr:hypothetical protein [Chelatococcus sp. XZ-Ab1]
MKHQKPTGVENRSIPLLVREAGVTSIDGGRRTFEVIWTTGAPVLRRDFWTDELFVEELVVSPNAIRMERLASGAAPFLSEHWRGMGVVERAWLDGSQGRALIRFPKAGIDADADRTFALIDDGIRKNVSVGYRVHRFEQERDADNRLVRRAVDWEPYEISSVTVGADPNARVRSEDRGSFDCTFETRAATIGTASIATRMRMRAAGLGIA